MARILIVEDETDLQQILEYNFKQAGYEVALASRGADAFKLARAIKPDVILLDIMLPDMLGTEVCRALKSSADTRAVPIVMVTAKGEEIDRVVGFELGADDYVVKPFSVRELVLRVGAILRRGKDSSSEDTLEFGELRIDRAAHRAWVSSEEVSLTPLEFRLLVTLVTRKNRVQSRASLLDDVWDMQADLTTRTVDTHVKRLREKLGTVRDYVETVRGVGYRFVGSPEEVGR
jgi:two-component system, OmpR family, phosphate regulon response regulator PhoB